MQRKTLQATLAAILSCFVASNSWAGAAFIGNEVPSARSSGQGYVGVAGQNEDPTVVYTNPGAMTSLKGTQATFGLHWENIHASYEDNAGNETKAHDVNVAVPNFSITQSFMNGKLSAGLSSQSPFGLETNWPGDSSLRYVATNSRLGMVQIMPALAYQIHPKFSIGAGPDYANVFRAQLDKHINNDFVSVASGDTPTGADDAISSLRGTGAGWGYHIGALVQPSEKHAIGIVYHSKINVRVNGNISLTGITSPTAQFVLGGSNYSTSAYTDILFPENIQMGYAFKPTEELTLEADAGWYHWSETKDINVRFPAANAFQLGYLANNANGTNVTPLSLKDTWNFNAGANYKLNEKWQLRGGAWYEPHSISEATYSPAFADLSRYGLSSGLGYALTQNMTVDVSYTAIFFHNRTINNNVGTESSGIPATGIPGAGVPSPDISGKYSNFANTIGIGLRYKFGA